MMHIKDKTIFVSIRGQALSESLIMLSVFSILFMGIQTTFSIQRIAVNTLLVSLKKVFEISLGKSIESDIEQNSSVLEHKSISVLEHKSFLNSGVNNLFAELKMAQPGMIQASSFSTESKHGQVKISRHSFVDTGYGYASSDRNVQQRFASSSTLWRNIFQITSKTMRPIHARSSKVDHAWNRADLSHDFVQPWKGFVPDQSILEADAWSN